MASKIAKAIADDPYQAESDMHTLMRAHEIRSDPKRHTAAKAHAKKKLAGMQTVAEDKGRAKAR
jgi:hypothetical protein